MCRCDHHRFPKSPIDEILFRPIFGDSLLPARKPGMLVRMALANEMARIVWALMARGDA